MNDLPEGWARQTLKEIADVNPRHAKSLDPTLKVSFVPMSAVSETSWRLNVVEQRELGEVRKAYTHFAEGDVLFAKITPCMENGKAAVALGLTNGLGCGTTELHVLRPVSGVEPKYVYYFLHQASFRQEAARNFSGTAGQLRVPLAFVEGSTIPLAPLSEQRRIVARLEEVLGNLDACQKRLAKIPVILKRFRQSVLATACSGRLTTDWRETNSHCESVVELLRLMSEKHQADAEALAQSECPNDEIPSSWKWARFGDLISELRNGVSIRPNMEPPGTPILRISAARPGRVVLDDIRYLSGGEEFFPQYKLADRDLLFTRYNGSLELLGVCGMVRDLGARELLYPDKLMRVRFEHAFVMPEYTEIFFQSPSAHERVIAKAKSSAGQNGVSGADIKSQPFALPPLPEQEEIVRRVEAVFMLADQIEARYRKAQGEVEKLTQSILAKAFRGELVPTEAELARREGCVRTRLNSSGSTTQGTCPAGQTKARRVARGVKQ